jgi:hypothetical protein
MTYTTLNEMRGKIMSKEVRSIEEALEVLKTLSVTWITTNRIRNNLWETGVAFFDKSHCRVAYYDEVNNLISIN